MSLRYRSLTCEGYGATTACNTITINRLDRVLLGSLGSIAPDCHVRIDEDIRPIQQVSLIAVDPGTWD